MDVFDSRYYKINKFVLSCIGQWVYQTFAMKCLTRTLIFLSLSTAVVSQLNFLVSIWGDVDATLECLPPLMLIFQCISQIVVFTINEKKLLNIANCIKRDWKFWSSRRELKILEKNAEIGRFFTLLYAGYVYMSVITFVFMSLSPIVLDILIPLNETRPKQPVYPVQFPFKQDKYFYWILVHGSLSTFFNLTVFFSCEAMLAVTTQHLCGLLEIISYRLKNIIKLSKGKRNNQNQFSKDQVYKEMSFTVEWHVNALGYAKTLESCFSPLLFFTLGLNVLNMSLLGIQTLNSFGNLVKTIKFGVFSSACFVHLYCISLPAQNLMDRSLEVVYEAYHGYWYEMPINSKKFLIMIIQRGQIPCTLTAGKICTLDMVTFSTLLKTSISYFTVLSSLR